MLPPRLFSPDLLPKIRTPMILLFHRLLFERTLPAIPEITASATMPQEFFRIVQQRDITDG